MAATFAWLESTGVGEGTTEVTNLNMGSVDAAELVPSTNPITIGDNGFEKWFRAKFSGSFTLIDNIQFWKSSGAYKTNEVIMWDGINNTYAQPTDSDSTVATTTVPTTDPGSANVSIGGTTTGTLTIAGESDYVVLQIQTETDTPVGPANQKEFTLQYDEQ